MAGGWLNTVGPLQKGKDIRELLDEHFPDMPKIGIAELNRHIMLIVNFYEHKEGEKNFRFSAKAFRERLEDQEDHIFTMNGYIDSLKNGLEIDIMIGYNQYLDAEMTKTTSGLMTYFHEIAANKDAYPEEAFKALCEHVTSIGRASEALVNVEMTKIRERLGFKKEEPAETSESLYHKFKKGLLSILPA